MKNLPPDYHIHTPLCHHATEEPDRYRSEASTQGIKEICFTDHAPNPDGYDPFFRMPLDRFPDYRKMINDIDGLNKTQVLFGIEADYYEGCEKFLRDWLPAQEFDYILGSVHYIENWGFDNPEERNIWDSVDIIDTWKKYFDLIARMADLNLFDAVAHLDLPKKFGHRPPEKDMLEIIQPTLDSLAKSGMGIELNTSGLRKPVGEIYPSLQILSLAKERDIPICFGSDAHHPKEVGADFDKALKLAQKAGYTHYFRIKNRTKYQVPLREYE